MKNRDTSIQCAVKVTEKNRLLVVGAFFVRTWVLWTPNCNSSVQSSCIQRQLLANRLYTDIYIYIHIDTQREIPTGILRLIIRAHQTRFWIVHVPFAWSLLKSRRQPGHQVKHLTSTCPIWTTSHTRISINARSVNKPGSHVQEHANQELKLYFWPGAQKPCQCCSWTKFWSSWEGQITVIVGYCVYDISGCRIVHQQYNDQESTSPLLSHLASLEDVHENDLEKLWSIHVPHRQSCQCRRASRLQPELLVESGRTAGRKMHSWGWIKGFPPEDEMLSDP